MQDFEAGLVQSRAIMGRKICVAHLFEHLIASGLRVKATDRVWVNIQLKAAHSGVELGRQRRVVVAESLTEGDIMGVIFHKFRPLVGWHRRAISRQHGANFCVGKRQ
jgi:hypothetical protein